MTGDGARLAKLRPSALDEDQRAVYDAIAGGRRAQGRQLFPLVDADGGLEGPFNALLLQPRLGITVQAVGASLRYETSLSDRVREIAILMVAAHRDCDFEWYAHAAVGRAIGLSEAELDAIRQHRYDAFPSTVEQIAAGTTHRLLDTGDLDDEAYANAVAALGEAQLFELLTLVGYYDMLALQLRVFRVPPPPSA